MTPPLVSQGAKDTHRRQIVHSGSCRGYTSYWLNYHPPINAAPFQTKTKRTAQKRYEAVLTLREQLVQQNSEAAAIFTFLERHWPKLVNAIESDLIPRTNNTVELVIRRFDQHYQNFCGFDSIATAHLFLAVFEKLYRFTPFSADAQPGIRGKCPLELAVMTSVSCPWPPFVRGLALIGRWR